MRHCDSSAGAVELVALLQLLRVGVKTGICSGPSYKLDFAEAEKQAAVATEYNNGVFPCRRCLPLRAGIAA